MLETEQERSVCRSKSRARKILHPGKNGMYLDVVKNQPHLRRFCLHAQARNHPLTQKGRIVIICPESTRIDPIRKQRSGTQDDQSRKDGVVSGDGADDGRFRLPGGGDAQLEG